MAKYDPLRDWLMAKRLERITLTFAEIEDILGEPLPLSAYKYQAWWSNQSQGTHVEADSWQDAGYRTSSLDLAGRRVTFLRT